jgi:hypothetical protein
VYRFVPDALQMVEEIGDLSWEHSALLERPQNFIERASVFRKKPVTRRYVLRHQLGKLTQLDQRAGGIVYEVMFRQRSQTGQLRRGLAQETEIYAHPRHAVLMSAKLVSRKMSRKTELPRTLS